MEVQCSRCKILQPISEYAKNVTRRNGLQSRCNDCRKKYNSSKEAKRKSKNRTLRHKYGITLEYYEQLLRLQKGVCKICSLPESAGSSAEGIKILCVDHDHETGQVRGLLCQRCNIGLGGLPTVKLLELAISYLESETAVAVV